MRPGSKVVNLPGESSRLSPLADDSGSVLSCVMGSRKPCKKQHPSYPRTYHIDVRRVQFMRRLANKVAGLLLASFLLISISVSAQIHGVPAGATSFPAGFNGFHGNFPPGIPASATSLGPRGFTPVRPFNQLNRFDNRRFRTDRLGRHIQPFFSPLGYSPFYYDLSTFPDYGSSSASYSPPTQAGNDSAPSKVEITVVDKRGDPARSETSTAAPDSSASAPIPAPPLEEAEAKTLVMRDGSKREIRNYAILGKNIFDLSDGRSRRIPLDDVDVPATTKVNEENGVDFKLP